MIRARQIYEFYLYKGEINQFRIRRGSYMKLKLNRRFMNVEWDFVYEDRCLRRISERVTSQKGSEVRFSRLHGARE